MSWPVAWPNGPIDECCSSRPGLTTAVAPRGGGPPIFSMRAPCPPVTTGAIAGRLPASVPSPSIAPGSWVAAPLTTGARSPGAGRGTTTGGPRQDFPAGRRLTCCRTSTQRPSGCACTASRNSRCSPFTGPLSMHAKRRASREPPISTVSMAASVSMSARSTSSTVSAGMPHSPTSIRYASSVTSRSGTTPARDASSSNPDVLPASR